MPAVFGNGQTFNGAFRAQDMRVTLAGAPVSSQIVQKIGFQFEQELNMLFEIGSNNVYYVGGRARGQASMERVVGPSSQAANFIATLGDICHPSDLTLTAGGGCTPSGGQSGSGNKYDLQGVVLKSIGGNIDAQEIVMHESLEVMYLNLDRS